MKKFILAAVAVLSSLCASAQAYVGGTLGLDRKFDSNQTEFSILPEVGYNFNDKWAAGITLGYQHKYNKGLSTNVGIIEPYARWTYYRSGNNLVNLFVDGGVGFGFGNSKAKGIDEHTKTVLLWNIGFKPGIAFNVTDKFTVLAHIGSLGYNGVNHAAERAGYESSWGLNFSSLDLNIGFYYNF